MTNATTKRRRAIAGLVLALALFSAASCTSSSRFGGGGGKDFAKHFAETKSAHESITIEVFAASVDGHRYGFVIFTATDTPQWALLSTGEVLSNDITEAFRDDPELEVVWVLVIRDGTEYATGISRAEAGL